MNSQLYNIYTKLKNIESHIGGEGGELDDYDLESLSTILTGNRTDILDENVYNLNNYNIDELTNSECGTRVNCYINIIDTNLKLVKNKESLHILDNVEYTASVVYTYIGKLYDYIIITYDNIINFDINEQDITYQLFDDHLNIKKASTTVQDAITFKNILNLNSYNIIGPNVFSEIIIDDTKSKIQYYNNINNNITTVNDITLKSSIDQMPNSIENKAVKLNSNNDIITHFKNGNDKIEFNDVKLAYYNSDTHNMYNVDSNGVIKKYTLQYNSFSFIECEPITTKTVQGVGLFVDNNDVIISYDSTNMYAIINNVIYSIETETNIHRVKLIHDGIVLVGCKDGTAYTMSYSEHGFVIIKQYKPTKGAITKIHTMEYADYIIWGDHVGFSIYNMYGLEVYSMNNAVAMTVLQYDNRDNILVAKNGKYEIIEYDSNLDTFKLKTDTFNLKDYIPYSINANKLSKTKFMTDEIIIDMIRPDIVYHRRVTIDVNMFDEFIGYISELDRIMVLRKNSVVIEPITYIIPSDNINVPQNYKSGMELAYNDVIQVFQINNKSSDKYYTNPKTLSTKSLKDGAFAYDGGYKIMSWSEPGYNTGYAIEVFEYGKSDGGKISTYSISNNEPIIHATSICDDSTMLTYKFVDNKNDLIDTIVTDSKKCDAVTTNSINLSKPPRFTRGLLYNSAIYPCPNNEKMGYVVEKDNVCTLYYAGKTSEAVSTRVFCTPYNSEYMGIYDNWNIDENNRFGCNLTENEKVLYTVKGSVGSWAILYLDNLRVVTAINLDTYETRCINSMQTNSWSILPDLTACTINSNKLTLNHSTSGPSVILRTGVKNIYKISQYKILYVTNSNEIYIYDTTTNNQTSITTKFNIILDFDKVVDVKINNKYIIIATSSSVYLFDIVDYKYINSININNIREIVLLNNNLDTLIVSDDGLYKLLSTSDAKNINPNINQNNSVQSIAGTEFFAYFKDSVINLANIDANNSISIITSIDTKTTISNYLINEYGMLFTNNSSTKLDIKLYDTYDGNLIGNIANIQATEYTMLDTVSDNSFIFIDHSLNTINVSITNKDGKSANIIPIHQIDGVVIKNIISIDNTLYYIDRHSNIIELTDCLSIYNK